MALQPKLLKYYLFFAVLLLVAVGAVVFTLSKATGTKADKATSAKMIEIAEKLESFTGSKGQIPETLDDVGVNNVSSAIAYTKVSETKYKICVTYNLDGTSFASRWSQFLASRIYKVQAGAPGGFSASFIDLYPLAFAYQKGQTCQTVTPVGVTVEQGLPPKTSADSADAKSGLITAGCGNAGSTFQLKDITTVKSVDAVGGVVTLDTAAAKLTDKNDTPISTLASIKYDSLTKIYGAGCKKATVSNVDSLKPGAAITVYLLTDDGTYADQIEL